MKKLWGGRIEGRTDPAVERLNASLSFDIRMYNEDIDGSRAWAGALAKAGILTTEELGSIQEGLEAVRAEFARGVFEPAPTDEDIHTAVERSLTEKIGAVAGKLHTGRSRNDQVATDFRLWVMRAADDLHQEIISFSNELVLRAEQDLNTPMPGYTHLQPAQPVTWGHWALSHVWAYLRDARRFRQVRKSASVLPLGSGALAGTGFPVDRLALAEALGFENASPNSLDAVGDRDFATGFLYSCALSGVHLSRLSEQLILFSSAEFGFIELDDAFATGSSLMPQKKNPDVLELARGKSGRLIGHLTGLLTTLKATPSAYDKDLQEDKEPVFDAYDTLKLLLPALRGLVRTLRLNPDRMAARLTPDLLATDLADYLVKKGIAFREAHEIAGKVVRLAIDRGTELPKLPLEDLQALESRFDSDVYQVFDLSAALSRRGSLGGTSPEALQTQLEAAKDELERLGSGTPKDA